MEESSFESLPDEAMLAIFHDLEDARNVASIAPVCGRWRELTRYVEHLRFKITTQPQLEAISGMLKRANSVKHLTITHISESLPLADEQLYEWINLAAPSLQHLNLSLATGKSPPDLWDHLIKCQSLRSVRFGGKLAIFFPILRASMNNLKECILDDETSIKFPAVQTILANCPAMEKLVVTNFPPIKVKIIHPALKSVLLHAQPQPGSESGPVVFLEAASLEYLTLDGVSCVLFAPQLLELHLLARCKDLIVVSVEKVRLLTVAGGEWEFNEIHSVVELFPNISELRLEPNVSDPEPVVWKTFFHGLSNVTNLSLGGNMLQCFCKEIDFSVLSEMKKLTSVNIHLQDECLELISAFLMHCSGMKRLSVECSGFVKGRGGESGEKFIAEDLFEARHPQLFGDLQKLQKDYPRVVQLKYSCV